VRVEDVDVVVGREVGVDLEPEEPAVPEVMDLGAEVGDDRERVRVDVGEDLDEAALLRDDHAAVRQETEGRRVGQAAEDDRLGEAGLLVGGREESAGKQQDPHEREERQIFDTEGTS
jgi:hypothetical protein